MMVEWAYETFVEIPEEGNSFRYHELEVKVFKMEHNRILSLCVTKHEEDATEGGEEE